MNIYNLYSTEAQFKNYLAAGKISAVSVRNYLSDLRYFCGWLQNTYGTTPIIEIIKNTPTLFRDYDIYLQNSGIAEKTTKRRLSTIRKYHEFLIAEGLLSSEGSFSTNIASTSTVPQRSAPIDFSKALSEFKYDQLMLENTDRTEALIKNVDDLFNFITDK